MRKEYASPATHRTHLTAKENVEILAKHLGWDMARTDSRVRELADLTRLPHAVLDRSATIESAEVLGLPRSARLRLIELPLALPSILAGVKTAAVINVGTATIGVQSN
jgi:osmoprotectant transport system permease protein